MRLETKVNQPYATSNHRYADGSQKSQFFEEKCKKALKHKIQHCSAGLVVISLQLCSQILQSAKTRTWAKHSKTAKKIKVTNSKKETESDVNRKQHSERNTFKKRQHFNSAWNYPSHASTKYKKTFANRPAYRFDLDSSIANFSRGNRFIPKERATFIEILKNTSGKYFHKNITPQWCTKFSLTCLKKYNKTFATRPADHFERCISIANFFYYTNGRPPLRSSSGVPNQGYMYPAGVHLPIRRGTFKVINRR